MRGATDGAAPIDFSAILQMLPLPVHEEEETLEDAMGRIAQREPSVPESWFARQQKSRRRRTSELALDAVLRMKAIQVNSEPAALAGSQAQGKAPSL